VLRPHLVLALTVAVFSLGRPATLQVQTPEQFFGFRIGTDGELAAYPKVLDYLRHLAASTNRMKFEVLGTTTMGHPYALATISSPENLARLDRLVAINRRLADPRGLEPAEAKRLAEEGRPFYLVFATIHSTEIANGQALIEVAHRLATDSSQQTRDTLANAVMLMVPSQNPDGQVLLIDHWYKTQGTRFDRNYPDLYHKYVGHDNNRDWFMMTQVETRLAIEKVQNAYKPQVTHDMHQTNVAAARIFVPPFDDPVDPNIHPLLSHASTEIGIAMATALLSEGKTGVIWNARYDHWTPARQYQAYHGQPRVLTEIAGANLGDPYVNPAGADKPLGPQDRRSNFPAPYTKGEWRLRQQVDYGVTAVLAGLTHVAKYPTRWLENFYTVHRHWVNFEGPPYAFVLPSTQRDPFETLELLDILRRAEVEIHRARTPFSAGGTRYDAGSWVIRLAQPYGGFAKTMLERQVYPDLRLYPGGPPKPPYDVTAHTLGLLMGVAVDQIDRPFEADLERVTTLAPTESPFPPRPKWAYLVGPESNAAFRALPKLLAANIPVFRAGNAVSSGGRSFAPGTWVVPPTREASTILQSVARETGLHVAGADTPLKTAGFRIKPETRIGLWKGARNMPGGWLMWLFEQYRFSHRLISSEDFGGRLADRYDVIVLPSETSRESILKGLDPSRHGPEWKWAFGVGEEGWGKLRQWVHDGGTLVAIGSAVETARELVGLPIEAALPAPQLSRTPAAGESADRLLRDAFQSPASLWLTLRDRVIEPTTLFYCPGSLLENQFDPAHPVAFGMPDRWPIFFESDQAYRLSSGFGASVSVAARYPTEGPLLQSGWLLGDQWLRGMGNAMSIRVGKGTVVALASQVDYRAQPRATFKLLFNAIFHGPATPVSVEELARLGGGS
jgi:hypothetical protein